MIKIKKDPLSIAISIIYSLNLLEEKKEYNINEIKCLTDLENHWETIQKYLKIFTLSQKYCPEIELNGSKLLLVRSKIYNKLTEKEKFILHLFNNQAFESNNAISIYDNFDFLECSKSIGLLYKKTENNKFYLTESGLEVYRSFKKDLTNLIYNEKEIDDVFEINEKPISITSKLPFSKIEDISEKIPESSEPIFMTPMILKSLLVTSEVNELPIKNGPDLTTE